MRLVLSLKSLGAAESDMRGETKIAFTPPADRKELGAQFFPKPSPPPADHRNVLFEKLV